MMFLFYIFLTVVSVSNQNEIKDKKEIFLRKRREVINEETDMIFGNDIKFTDNEINANEIIMKYKRDEIDYGFVHPGFSNFSHHYFNYKDVIKISEVYQIIEKMPKGAALHVHSIGILKPDYIVNITYHDNLYVCFDNGSVRVKMLFSNKAPNHNCSSKWRLMKEARYASGNITQFDEMIRKEFTLVVPNPNELYTDVNRVWTVFFRIFMTIEPLLTYRPIWEQYFYDVLKEFRRDNVMYVEIRTELPSLYELDGTIHDAVYNAKVYNDVTEMFRKEYPDFIRAKLIYAPYRLATEETVSRSLLTAKKVKELFPKIFAGFDLVGQEDLGKPLIDFVNQLLEYDKDFDYIFHAGETNWYGLPTDWNLLDAILLGAKRLGHAYALVKHPKLMEMVKSKDIALEMNVISNHVLKLVDDVRNHPMNIFMANDMPIVLSSDDPGLWEAEPISHDYYVSFIGVMSRSTDLKALKKLVWNSIKYSSLDSNEKLSAMTKLEQDWNEFILNVIRTYKSSNSI